MLSKYINLIFFVIATMLLPFALKANSGKYEITSDGLIVYPNAALAGNAQIIKLQVISDKIIRIIASADSNFSNQKSLITVYSKSPEKTWSVQEITDGLVLKTNLLIAIINTETGAVSFTDINGKPILKEKQINGRSLEPTVYDGDLFYKIRQTFETTTDDAIYGLGQHQDGIVNYRNQQVNLFQNNTEVAVPFLISSKNYGILWDNYSLSTIGDIRPFEQLSALKLFS